MTDPKLCKDCKYCRRDWFFVITSFGTDNGYEFAKCTRPVPSDLVSGTQKLNAYCNCERVSYQTIDTCGEEAKYFEQK